MDVKRSFLAPEVVQTSNMDCGPAALKCLLDGYGLSVSYGRLREGCQTDVDGTSIDTLEEVALQLGLEAEQVILPLDHLLLSQENFPALIVVMLPSGLTHFVVLWRRHGRFVQLMDPATGRRWLSTENFLREVYTHTMLIPTEAWREWVEGDDFLLPLRQRMKALGIAGAAQKRLVETALADEGWWEMAALDAAVRMVTSIVEAEGLEPGKQATSLLSRLLQRARKDKQEAGEGGGDGEAQAQVADEDGQDGAVQAQEVAVEPFGALASGEDIEERQALAEGGWLGGKGAEFGVLPASYWSAWEGPADEDGDAQLFVRGCVLVRVEGRHALEEVLAAQEEGGEDALSPELQAALQETPVRPWRDILNVLREDGWLTPWFVLLASLLAAAGLLVEALLFRGFLELGGALVVTEQRLMAVGGILALSVAILLLEMPIMLGMLRMGRHLEVRLRLEFLEKLPKLNDRYFQSRLVSDMAERSHSIQIARKLPAFGVRWLRSLFELSMTALGIMWLAPTSGWAIVLLVVGVFGVTYAMQPLTIERDLRMRTHVGALSRFYLDALLGIFPIRAHGAQRVVRREHEGLLVAWMHAGFGMQRAIVLLESLLALLGVGLVGWLVLHYLLQVQEPAGVLLLTYWALRLPPLSHELAQVSREYPVYRNVVLRLMEPLGAPEEPWRQQALLGDAKKEPVPRGGAALTLEGVDVVAAGNQILEDISLEIEAGSQVAIVGASGAGKSSLVGLLLGWHRPAAGRLLLDGEPLSAQRIEQLRLESAWVDPQIQLWNRSLLENLYYGVDREEAGEPSEVLSLAALRGVLEDAPDGLQTVLGDGGALLSGGQGQRVRFGRGLLRKQARLVIMDEPFRGLDRGMRRTLMERARGYWAEATVLCITHDVEETMNFPRVLVIEDGHLVEDGDPRALAQQEGSRYRALVEAEREVRQGLWEGASWRRLWLGQGGLQEKPAGEGEAD